MKFLRIIVVLMIVILSGCASFQGHILPEVSSFPQVGKKSNVSVNLTYRAYLNHGPSKIPPQNELFTAICVKRFIDSGLFSTVGRVSKNSDISVVIDMKDEGDVNFAMAFLTGFTLYIIPSSATDDFQVKAVLTNNYTGSTKTIEINDSVTMWQEILLLPLAPFKTHLGELNKVVNNIFDTLAIRVYEFAQESSPVKKVETDAYRPMLNKSREAK